METFWRGLWIVVIGGVGLWGQDGYRQAQRLTRERKWEQAVRAWQKLLITEGDSGRRALIYQQLGYIALYRGDSAEALALWKQSLQYHPTYRTAWENYIWLRQRLRVPPPIEPLRYARYIALPPPTEKAPPTWGRFSPDFHRPMQWLPAERLAR
jgi:tetratricopeptide (TPR) repeat protein